MMKSSLSQYVICGMILIILIICDAVVSRAENLPYSPPVIAGVNESSVRRYCDVNPLDKLEGLWVYPDDGVLLWICKVEETTDISAKYPYQIIVVKSEDQYVSPGQVIGYMSITPDPEKFRMWLYSDVSHNKLIKPKECAATIMEDGYSLAFTSKERKIRINPLGLLPRLWRIVKMQTDNPVDKLPEGFVKVYPGYDGNGSMLHIPRYL